MSINIRDEELQHGIEKLSAETSKITNPIKDVCSLSKFNVVDDQLKQAQHNKMQELQQHLLQNMPDFSDFMRNLTLAISPAVKTFSEFAKSMQPKVEEFLASFIGCIDSIANAIKQYDKLLPIYQANAEIWGKYGWSIFPELPIEYLLKAPKSSVAATRFANRYFSEYKEVTLFHRTKTLCDNYERYNEAVALYRHKKYYGCACILFSLIDGEIILSQKIPVKEKNRRMMGKKGFDNILATENKFKGFLLFHFNIAETLAILFKDGDDFKVQPKVINRNFLMHGMMRRAVTQKDCRQLFLLYYNLKEHIKFLKEFCNVQTVE